MTTGGDLSFHLPYSEAPEDEFCAPDGQWYSTLRAVTFDNWLIWRNVLPDDLTLWPQLTADVFETVQCLAKRIHHIHQLFPDYRRLWDSPFKVSRWWDPTDDTDEWLHGDRVLLRIQDYTAKDIQQLVPTRLKGQLYLQPRSTNWIEISLPPIHPPEADETL